MSVLSEQAQRATDLALSKGADAVTARVTRQRSLLIKVRNGQVEERRQSLSSRLSLEIYIDGRYGMHRSSDFEDLEAFVGKAVRLTQWLEADSDRGLADPKYYLQRPSMDLELFEEQKEWDGQRPMAILRSLEAKARHLGGPIVSISTSMQISESHHYLIHSNGFSDGTSKTSLRMGMDLSMQDQGNRKPSEGMYAHLRHWEDLPDLDRFAQQAHERAIKQLNARSIVTQSIPVIVENRAARILIWHFIKALYGRSLQQEQSFLKNAWDQKIGSKHFELFDDPLIPRGLGSRRYDGQGLSSKRRLLIDKGIFKQGLIDVYYGRKMKRAPTTGSPSNIVLTPGQESVESWISKFDKALYVTQIIGGNSDTTRGDFSHGIRGYWIEKGKCSHAVSEVNLTGNHGMLWHRLIGVCSDPYPWSSTLIPTLIFDGLSVSGS